jgi:calcium-dependent protein kinase
MISSNKSNQQYALKSIHLDKCKSETLQRELKNEIAILRELDHPHIARAIETYQVGDERLFVVLELCSGGDLYARDPYSEQQAASILASVLSAISYLHSKGIVHRDLKFENIMFVDNRPEAEVKLIDFGLSQKFAAHDSNLTDAVGTVYTMAPEVLAGKYNAKADIWSIGVVAFMLLSSSMPFYGPTRYAVIKKILKGRARFTAKRWKTVSKYGKGLVRLLLEHDPNERPSADRALKYTKVWLHHIRQTQCPNPDTATTTTNQQRRLRWKQQDSMASYGTASWEDDVEMMDRIQVSIQAFAQYNTLKKLALLVIAYKSTASEIGWLRTTFNRFDLLQNGEISLEEFSEALSEVYDYTEEEMEALFAGMDVDGTGSVHYTEFLAATMEAHGSIEEDRIADAFDRIGK